MALELWPQATSISLNFLRYMSKAKLCCGFSLIMRLGIIWLWEFEAPVFIRTSSDAGDADSANLWLSF